MLTSENYSNLLFLWLPYELTTDVYLGNAEMSCQTLIIYFDKTFFRNFPIFEKWHREKKIFSDNQNLEFLSLARLTESYIVFNSLEMFRMFISHDIQIVQIWIVYQIQSILHKSGFVQESKNALFFEKLVRNLNHLSKSCPLAKMSWRIFNSGKLYPGYFTLECRSQEWQFLFNDPIS